MSDEELTVFYQEAIPAFRYKSSQKSKSFQSPKIATKGSSF